MLRPSRLLAACCALWLAALPLAGQPASKPSYPPTKSESVSEKLHGQEVADPYRWLEKQTAPEVKAWIEAQNAFTRSVLDALPGRQKIARRFAQLSQIGSLTAPIQAKGRLFYLRREGAENQPSLRMREGETGRDRALLNPNLIDPTGLTAIDWFFPSPNGRFVAFGLSTGGTELSTLQIADVEERRLLPEKIDRTRACSVAWARDAAGFWYTRYPAAGSVPAGEESYHRHVYFHKLGADPSKDVKVFGQDRPKEDWPNLAISPNGKWLLIISQQGWSKTELFLKDTASAEPARSLGCKDAVHEAVLDNEHLYIRTNDGAPRFKVMKAALAKPDRADWAELVAESKEDSLQDLARVGTRLALHYLHDCCSRLDVITTAGVAEPGVSLPSLGTVTGLGGDEDGDDFYFSYVNFLTPTCVYRRNMATAQVDLWQQLFVPDFARDAYTVEQLRFTSKDKTESTMFVVRKRSLKKDGQNPTLLYGYGGFAANMTPSFRADFVQFVENGGVAVLAVLRGGAEHGEGWHQAGMLGKKQNVFDDFIAAAERLCELKYTSPEKLAIQGGSNGGLLVVAAATQRPELFRAVVCQVPLTDMIRYHLFGIARLWIPEYGDPANPEQFAWLIKYSPYHAVKDQTKYPAMLLTAAAGDSRVDPLHACKLAARLQAASTNDRPILLRLESQAGHGAGKSRRQAVLEQTDLWSFLYAELGVAP